MRRFFLMCMVTCLWIHPLSAQGQSGIEQLMDAASQARDKVENERIKLTREVWMESHDLDHMPPSREADISNIGPGPRAYVTAAFHGADLARQKFLRDSWFKEAAALSKQIERTRQALLAEGAKFRGKAPDVATMEEDGTTVYSYSDPKLQAAEARVRELSGELEEQCRQLTAVLDRIAVSNTIIRPQLKSSGKLTGTYRVTQKNKNGKMFYGTLKLIQTGESLRGTLTWQNHETGDDFTGSVKGDYLTFALRYSGGLVGTYVAKFSGDGSKLTGGSCRSNRGDSGSWSADRTGP